MAARITSRFWLPRSDSATLSVLSPGFAATLAGAVVGPLAGAAAFAGAWVGPAVAGAVGGAAAGPQAASNAVAPPAASNLSAVRRFIPPFEKDWWRFTTRSPFRDVTGPLNSITV